MECVQLTQLKDRDEVYVLCAEGQENSGNSKGETPR